MGINLLLFSKTGYRLKKKKKKTNLNVSVSHRRLSSKSTIWMIQLLLLFFFLFVVTWLSWAAGEHWTLNEWRSEKWSSRLTGNPSSQYHQFSNLHFSSQIQTQTQNPYWVPSSSTLNPKPFLFSSPLHLSQTHHRLSSKPKPTTSSPSFASLFPTPSFSSSPPVPTPTDSASFFSLSKLPVSTPGAPKTMTFYTKVPASSTAFSGLRLTPTPTPTPFQVIIIIIIIPLLLGICWLLHCALCIGLLFSKFIILLNFPEFLV